MPTPEDTEANLELINDELIGAVAAQRTSGAQVDSKVALIGGLALTAAQFLASRDDVVSVLASAAYIAYGISFVSAIAAYAVSRYRSVPNPRVLVSEYASGVKTATLKSLIAERVKALEANKKKYQWRAKLATLSIAALAVGSLLGILAVLVHTEVYDRAHTGTAHHRLERSRG